MIGTTQLHQRFKDHGLSKRVILEKAYLIQESMARAFAMSFRSTPNGSRPLTENESLRRWVNKGAHDLWMRWIAVMNDEEIQDEPLSKMERQAMALNALVKQWVDQGGHLE